MAEIVAGVGSGGGGMVDATVIGAEIAAAMRQDQFQIGMLVQDAAKIR